MQCDAIRDQMLDVLYSEADAATLGSVQAHVETCAACRDELAALRKLRRELGSWTLPSLVPFPSGRRPASWRPVAIAASLLLAAGGALGLSGAELRFENGRFSARLGRGRADFERALAQQEARHRSEIDALRAVVAAPAGTGTGIDEGALLASVEQKLERSEARQTQLLDARVNNLADRFEAQRRYDMAQVSAGLSYLEGKTGLQMARTTELVGHVLQVSQQK